MTTAIMGEYAWSLFCIFDVYAHTHSEIEKHNGVKQRTGFYTETQKNDLFDSCSCLVFSLYFAHFIFFIILPNDTSYFFFRLKNTILQVIIIRP
jgi:hypothetical protein